MTSGELEDFIRQVVASGTLLEFGSEGGSQPPKELLRSTMTSNTTSLDKFLTALGEGLYDTSAPKTKVSVRKKCISPKMYHTSFLVASLERSTIIRYLQLDYTL